MLGLYVPPTAKVIRRGDLSIKSHPKDWRSLGSISQPLLDGRVYLETACIRTLQTELPCPVGIIANEITRFQSSGDCDRIRSEGTSSRNIRLKIE